MKDLMISYDNENGERIHKVYDHIFDFTDALESDDVDVPMIDYQNVDAYFFENPLNHNHFDTIQDLYYHCKLIME